MTRLLSRLVRIRWGGFAHTRHWLRGIAFIDYVVREEFIPVMSEQLNAQNPLFDRLALSGVSRGPMRVTDITES